MKRNPYDTGRAPDEVQYYDWRLTRWNTSETRERLDATGRGIYRELMDQCYAQGSFPDDAGWISRKCACSVKDYQKWWPIIERHFPLTRTKTHRHNIFADIWRKSYFSICESNRKNGKSGGAKSVESRKISSGRQATAQATAQAIAKHAVNPKEGREGREGREETNTDARVCEIPRRENESPPSARFEEWWALWSSVKGTNHRPQAESAYFRLVTTANERACLDCTRSYLDSLRDPSKGYNPENFLEDQARAGFTATWPKARDSPRQPTANEIRRQEVIAGMELIDKIRGHQLP